VLPAWIWPVLDLWALCRSGGGMGGIVKHPPGPGGMGDQPAALMDAFAMIDRLMAERQPK
jgi:hypothetical protein